MPACHGSGGLAGQYRFGARSGSSIIFLGSVKFLLGIVCLFEPTPIMGVLSNIPKSLLGVLVLAAGIELAKVGESLNTNARDLRVLDGEQSWDGKDVREIGESERRDRWSTMLVTVAGILAFRNDAVGFVAGLVWHWGIKTARSLQQARDEANERPFWRSVGHQRGESTGLLRHEESDRIA
jgi:hypothetical protein